MPRKSASHQLDPRMQLELIDVYRKAIQRGVSIDAVEQEVQQHLRRLQAAESVEAGRTRTQRATLKKNMPKALRVGSILLPVVFIAVGLYLVGSATLPILSYYLHTAPQLQAAQLAAPVPQDELIDITPVVITQVAAAEAEVQEPRMLDSELDYTNLSNWFEAQSVNLAGEGSESIEYTLDIPTLNITNARVEVGGTDLNKNLIAYPGTAMPGDTGSPVIFGHSVLRQFYNPSEKNPRRYNSIFSTIMTLQKGDKIYVTQGGVKYTYMVLEKTEVKPEDVYILSQRHDVRQLKLVTCTPEGTYLRRGVVTAQLVESAE